jgi:hypothetical protein
MNWVHERGIRYFWNQFKADPTWDSWRRFETLISRLHDSGVIQNYETQIVYENGTQFFWTISGWSDSFSIPQSWAEIEVEVPPAIIERLHARAV